MYERQIANEASQLAGAIEQNPNDMNSAAQLLIADTQGMRIPEAHNLINQTNMILQSDSQRDGCQYGQIFNPHERNQDGLPFVELIDGNNQVAATAGLQINEQPPAPFGYQAANPEYAGYEPGQPTPYYPQAQPYEYGGYQPIVSEPYYERPQPWLARREYGWNPEPGFIYNASPAEGIAAVGADIALGFLFAGRRSWI